MGPAATAPAARKRSLFELIGELPNQVSELVRREIELVKAEMTAKLKALGSGGGLLAGAVVVLLFMVGVLLTAAVLGLAEVMPGWAAALIVAGVLLIIAAGYVGWLILGQLWRGVLPVILALIVCTVLSTPNMWLRRLKFPPALAAMITIIIFFAVIAGVFWLIAPRM